MSNYILVKTIWLMIYPCPNLGYTLLVKRPQRIEYSVKCVGIGMERFSYLNCRTWTWSIRWLVPPICLYIWMTILHHWFNRLTHWLTVSSWRVYASVNWLMRLGNGLWPVRYPPDHCLNWHKFIAKTNISVLTSATSESKRQLFVSGKWIWNCQLFISEKWIWESQLQIVGHCFQVTMC